MCVLDRVSSLTQVAKMRSVCKRMDSMCGSHLNLGFRNAEKYHTQLMKKFKSREVVLYTRNMCSAVQGCILHGLFGYMIPFSFSYI